MSEPISGSSYIIICNGRIEVAAADSPTKKIVAASNTAAQLTSFMQGYYSEMHESDLGPISTLQHQLMDHLTGANHLSHEEIDARITALFHEFDELEDKYSS